MIGFPTASHQSFRLPPRTERTALDKERNFLTRIVGQSLKKEVSRNVEACERSGNRK